MRRSLDRTLLLLLWVPGLRLLIYTQGEVGIWCALSFLFKLHYWSERRDLLSVPQEFSSGHNLIFCMFGKKTCYTGIGALYGSFDTGGQPLLRWFIVLIPFPASEIKTMWKELFGVYGKPREAIFDFGLTYSYHVPLLVLQYSGHPYPTCLYTRVNDTVICPCRNTPPRLTSARVASD